MAALRPKTCNLFLALSMLFVAYTALLVICVVLTLAADTDRRVNEAAGRAPLVPHPCPNKGCPRVGPDNPVNPQRSRLTCCNGKSV